MVLIKLTTYVVARKGKGMFCYWVWLLLKPLPRSINTWTAKWRVVITSRRSGRHQGCSRISRSLANLVLGCRVDSLSGFWYHTGPLDFTLANLPGFLLRASQENQDETSCHDDRPTCINFGGLTDSHAVEFSETSYKTRIPCMFTRTSVNRGSVVHGDGIIPEDPHGDIGSWTLTMLHWFQFCYIYWYWAFRKWVTPPK